MVLGCNVQQLDFTKNFDCEHNMSSPTPTETSSLPPGYVYLAQTTPFVQPRHCEEVGDVTFFSTDGYLETALVSWYENPKYLSCQPSGMSSIVLANRQTLSPGVCPSGWWAARMSTLSIPGNLWDAEKEVTTALCCHV